MCSEYKCKQNRETQSREGKRYSSKLLCAQNSATSQPETRHFVIEQFTKPKEVQLGWCPLLWDLRAPTEGHAKPCMTTHTKNLQTVTSGARLEFISER